MEKYPVMYEESMNTVLVQEVIRYNRLIKTIIQTLKDLLKALKGLVVMSQQLEEMSISLYNNSVPKIWADKAYPSLKPLAAWVDDLVDRVKFIDGWINDGIPTVFWYVYSRLWIGYTYSCLVIFPILFKVFWIFLPPSLLDWNTPEFRSPH